MIAGLVAPDARPYDAQGRVRHYGGPALKMVRTAMKRSHQAVLDGGGDPKPSNDRVIEPKVAGTKKPAKASALPDLRSSFSLSFCQSIYSPFGCLLVCLPLYLPTYLSVNQTQSTHSICLPVDLSISSPACLSLNFPTSPPWLSLHLSTNSTMSPAQSSVQHQEQLYVYKHSHPRSPALHALLAGSPSQSLPRRCSS